MSLSQDDFLLRRGPFHEQYLHLNDMPPVIQKSLQRCWPRLHLEEETCIPPNKLSQLLDLNSHLLKFAKPIMDEIHQSLRGNETAVILVDSSGYLIHILGEPAISTYLDERAITVGSDLSEYGAGTNAFGLAIMESAPMQVEGSQHFLRKFQNLFDVAAPIFDASSQLLGAVGMIGFFERQHSYSLGLAVMAARSIMEQARSFQIEDEKNYQVEKFEQILSTIDDGVLAWDEDGQIIYLNPACEVILGLNSEKQTGRPFTEVIHFPKETLELIKRENVVCELETSFTLNRNQVPCLLSWRKLPGDQGTSAFLRLHKNIQKYVTREFSLNGCFGLEDVVGSSQQMRQVRRQVKAVANAKASVLINGQLGTGKSLLAQVIHCLSNYKDGPFIVFQCASLPCEMIISELIGMGEDANGRSIRHSNKFELADGGVLYFQDIDLLPLEAQGILLDFLKSGMVYRFGSSRRSSVQTRIIAASTVSLPKLVDEGKFDRELFSRLSVFQIELPPLKERKEDIAVLAHKILVRLCSYDRSVIHLAPESLALLLDHDWPGNIRDLEIVLERAVYNLGSSTIITPAHLPLSLKKIPIVTQKVNQTDAQPVSQIQQEALLKAARDCQGNVSEMARTLGIGRTTVWRWLKRMDISVEEFRTGSSDSK